jgi:hypothetical protein
MSQENLELAKRAQDLFEAGGIEAALVCFAPDVIAYPFPEWVEESEYRGHDGLRALIALWTDNFDEFEIHEDEFRDGLIGETRNFLTWRKALDTVGLSE